MLERLHENLLTITLFLPLLGAGLIWAFAAQGKTAVRRCALGAALVTLAAAIWLIWGFVGSGASSPAVGAPILPPVSPSFQVQFAVGLDGLSVWLFGLSALLTVTALLVSWEAIGDRPATFYGMLLLLETGMLGVFAAKDIILFYIFFEFTLIPLFFLIGIWGSEERRYAAVKFFIFTFAGSVLTFLGLLVIVLWHQSQSAELTFSIPRLTAGLAQHGLPIHLQLWIFLALFAGFAIKVPLFPLHTWLPLAHTQAPTAGSVILAGILLKIGAYGFVRFNLTMLPEASAVCMPWLLWLAVIGIIYGALVALAQTDMKRVIAYSSVSHMGFCILGLFALNRAGGQGGVLQMINHGLSTGGLFALIGMIYERYHTRKIADFGGLWRRMPRLTFCMLVFTFSSIGLPGLNGFAGEYLILQGMFQRAWSGAPAYLGHQLTWIAVVSVFGVVLGAWYMLWLVQRLFFGPLREPVHDSHAPAAEHVARHAATGHAATGHAAHGTETDGHAAHDHAAHGHAAHGHAAHGHGEASALPPGPSDLNLREALALAPLAVFVFWIGLAPNFFLKTIRPTIDPIVDRAAQAVSAPLELNSEKR